MGPQQRLCWPKRTDITSLHQILGEQLSRAVYPLHRLDRPTSGVILFALERSHAHLWQEQLAHPSTQKVYLALVRGLVEECVWVDHPLRDKGVAKAARSEIIPLASSASEHCSLVRVHIHTGRRHQVRRHLKHLSHPLIGDTAYGKGAINRYFRLEYGLYRLALHAWQLQITHPQSGERLLLCAPLPASLSDAWARLFPDVVNELLQC
ncbi:MAG: pseudouridylate synthase [Chloroflexi bacterium]|nr:pseudouridylate synthase [Chloroflexota bacterium]